MTGPSAARGRFELWRTLRRSGWIGGAILIFSGLANLLVLAGPLYMLQVYDRVLPSRSTSTLVALSVLLVVCFVAMGLLDHARGRLAARVGAAFLDDLDLRVLRAGTELARTDPKNPAAASALQDLESVQRVIASPVLLALCDMPWVPIFAGIIFVLHPVLGAVAVAGTVVLVVITLLNQWMTKKPLIAAGRLGLAADGLATTFRRDADTLRGLGMQSAAQERWMGIRRQGKGAGLRASDLSGGFSVLTKTFRQLLQSIMLGVGAWLVLQEEIGAGAMIASSILMGRALAPTEMVIGQWALVTRAREGWRRLSGLLTAVPPAPARTALPRPAARIVVRELAIYPPGEAKALLRNIGFEVRPGQAVGVIGPSGSGKSTLARALTGLARPTAGDIRLGGAALDQYDPDTLGGLMGYLPQQVTLFEGTVADNIARLTPDPDAAAVVRAAERAGAHQMILGLPHGYDTPLSPTGAPLSGGQVQRLGLARALFGDPVCLVLDEPNSNLDQDGTAALNGAIRHVKAAGGVVFIMAHRPAAIQECDLLLVLDKGTQRLFGPRDTVLRDMVRPREAAGERGVA
ncbi:type I secretion system permease/ATPase [Falsirhodobacter halotolerans]|uniref:type I secretion system permease/ATPase n=1 Tax=Falsirhodobacter halotolerans TaxID=1146892 RepID=UPI001FD0792D|nr:type I secretion system permease/ATPase [Falsirhodobacter halotolerans]MCJ8141247.1 type I secretion system permease/ATPase [Falsirhodobacter halotolerans]